MIRTIRKRRRNPIAIWSEYVSDFADIEQVNDFETEMCYLESIGLITIQAKDGVIGKLVARSEKLTDYYELLQRKRKKMLFGNRLHFLKSGARMEKL